MAVWGGDGVAELAKEISAQVKKLKKPEIKGGAVDGVVIGPAQVEDITKLPSREALIGRVVGLALAPPSAWSPWPTPRRPACWASSRPWPSPPTARRAPRPDARPTGRRGLSREPAAIRPR